MPCLQWSMLWTQRLRSARAAQSVAYVKPINCIKVRAPAQTMLFPEAVRERAAPEGAAAAGAWAAAAAGAAEVASLQAASPPSSLPPAAASSSQESSAMGS